MQHMLVMRNYGQLHGNAGAAFGSWSFNKCLAKVQLDCAQAERICRQPVCKNFTDAHWPAPGLLMEESGKWLPGRWPGKG